MIIERLQFAIKSVISFLTFCLLQFSESPKFMNQLEVNSREVSVDEQGEARLDCLFHGFPMPTITWKRDGKDLTKNIRYKISDDGLLRITNAVVDDTGKYTCYVSSIAGLLERDIGLVVIGKCQHFIVILCFLIYSSTGHQFRLFLRPFSAM